MFVIIYTISTLFFEYILINFQNGNSVSSASVVGVVLSLINYLMPEETINDLLFDVDKAPSNESTYYEVFN